MTEDERTAETIVGTCYCGTPCGGCVTCRVKDCGWCQYGDEISAAMSAARAQAVEEAAGVAKTNFIGLENMNCADGVRRFRFMYEVEVETAIRALPAARRGQ